MEKLRFGTALLVLTWGVWFLAVPKSFSQEQVPAEVVHQPPTENPPTPSNDIDDLKPRIDAFIKPLLANGHNLGLVVGLIYKGQSRVWGYGTRSSKDNRPPDGDTEFEIGSVTKLFTKLLFSDMVLKGEMGLEGPAQNYMPHGMILPTKNGKQITLLQLAMHTAGFPGFPDNFKATTLDDFCRYKVPLLYDYVTHFQLDREPGSKFEYSNVGVALLAQLIGLKSKKTYGEYLQQRVLDPLGLKDTGVVWTASESARAAEGTDLNGNPVKPLEWDEPTFMPCGAIHSTANDMLKMAQQLLQRGSSPLADIAFGGTAGQVDWGPQVQHSGGSNGFASFFFIDRNTKTVFVVWIRSARGAGYLAAGRLLRLLSENPAKNIPTQASRPQLSQPVPPYPLNRAQLSWGKAQIQKMLKDRPEMAKYVREGDDLWNWTVRQFAGEYIKGGVRWDSGNPTDSENSSSDGPDPGKNEKAYIQVTPNCALEAPRGLSPSDAKNYHPGDPKTGPFLWCNATKELCDLINDAGGPDHYLFAIGNCQGDELDPFLGKELYYEKETRPELEDNSSKVPVKPFKYYFANFVKNYLIQGSVVLNWTEP